MSIPGYDHHRAAELLEDMGFKEELWRLWQKRLQTHAHQNHPLWESECRRVRIDYERARRRYVAYVRQYLKGGSGDGQ